MKVVSQERENCQITAQIEVSLEEIKEQTDKAYRDIGRAARVPGFRPGKVPRRILENRYGDTVRNDVLKEVLTASFEEAVSDEGWKVLSGPEIKDVVFEDAEPLTYTAVIEVSPEVKLGQYKGLKLAKEQAEVTDEEVAEALEDLREQNAKYVSVDRPAQLDDQVTVDYDGRVDDKPFVHGTAENVSVLLSSGGRHPEFEGALIGASKGNELDISVTLPENHPDPELAGKRSVLKTTVKEVKAKELPLLDDEFAKDVSESETLEALKDTIRQNLLDLRHKHIEETLRAEALAKAVDQCEYSLPQTFLARYENELLAELRAELMRRGMSDEEFREKETELRESCHEDAVRHLGNRYVVDAIAEAEGISVVDQELDEKTRELQEKVATDRRLAAYLGSPDVRERYRDRLKTDKVLDFLIQNAEIEGG